MVDMKSNCQKVKIAPINSLTNFPYHLRAHGTIENRESHASL